jgi:hypothetical protein
MHEYRGSGGLVPLVLNLAPCLEVMVNFTLQLLYLCEKQLSTPIKQEAEWAPGQVWTF